ncbi:MAG: universal stress protein [Kurthia sp.]|nr:universal stress protein [Candidatus Kurthia equi]
MFANKIVVAYNDTDLSNDLLDYVHGILALNSEIKLDIIYSYDEPVGLQSAFHQNFDSDLGEMEGVAQKIILKGEEKFADLPNSVEGYICKGSPATAILDHAKSTGADLIVIGNRGFTGIREFVSSVSRTVQSKAHIPVLIFPKFAKKDLEQE